MQQRAVLSRQKKWALLVSGILAIGAMVTAPDGAVSGMVVRAAQMASPSQPLDLVLPVQPAPVVHYQDENGKMRRLSESKGQVTIVNFWALWCASCKLEKPLLNQLQVDYAAKGLRVIALSDSGDAPEMVKNYYKNNGFAALKPAIDKDGSAFQAFDLRGVPSSIILNKKGDIVARQEGLTEWDNPEIRTQLEKWLAE